jgi:hypothetical protein
MNRNIIQVNRNIIQEQQQKSKKNNEDEINNNIETVKTLFTDLINKYFKINKILADKKKIGMSLSEFLDKYVSDDTENPIRKFMLSFGGTTTDIRAIPSTINEKNYKILFDNINLLKPPLQQVVSKSKVENESSRIEARPSSQEPRIVVSEAEAEAESKMKQIIERFDPTRIKDNPYQKTIGDTFIELFRSNPKSNFLIPEENRKRLYNNINNSSVQRNYRSIFEILIQAKKRLESLKWADGVINNTIRDVSSSINSEQNKFDKSNQLSQLKLYIANGNIDAPIPDLFKNKKNIINEYIKDPNKHSANIPETLRTITSKLVQQEQQPSRKSTASLSRPTTPRQSSAAASRPLSRPTTPRQSSAASSRPTTPRQSSAAASLPESGCTLLNKTLMPELGDILTLSPSMRIPEIYQFLLSNKRYCYHIMRNYSGNDFLIELINYLYNKSQKLPQIKPLYEKIEDFPGINDIFDRISIESSDNLEQYIQATSKKNVLFTITSKSEVRVPRILSNYVLVSYMNNNNTNILYKSIPYETIILPNPDTRRAKTVILNYQHMQFPISITPSTTNQVIRVTNQSSKPNININSSISGSRRNINNGGNKTIRKYRKHNRNKTTRNYN